MKKFQFSLEKVLSYKNQINDVLMNELAVLQHELQRIDDKIAELQRVFADTNNRMVSDMSEGVSSASISVFKIYLNDISTQITRKLAERERQLRRIEGKQQEIINSNVEIASLDKLKEKQLSEYNVLAAKAQEVELNEFIGNSMN